MTGLEFALVVAAVAAVGSTVATVKSAKAQNKAAKEANKVERRMADVTALRERKQAIAARNARDAELVAGAVSSGVDVSSGLQGARGALGAQTASNIGYANSAFASQKAISDILLKGQLKAQKFRNVAAGFSTVQSIAGNVASYKASSGGNNTTPKFEG